MQQISDINDKLGLQGFNVISAVPSGSIDMGNYSSGNSKSITVGDTYINITGSVDDVTLGKIEEMIKEENEKMLDKIAQNL